LPATRTFHKGIFLNVKISCSAFTFKDQQVFILPFILK